MTIDVLVEVSVGSQDQLFTYGVNHDMQPKIKKELELLFLLVIANLKDSW